MEDKEKILKLLEQIIEKAEADDLKDKAKMLAKGKGSRAIGESWTVYHLKALKELIEGVNISK